MCFLKLRISVVYTKPQNWLKRNPVVGRLFYMSIELVLRFTEYLTLLCIKLLKHVQCLTDRSWCFKIITLLERILNCNIILVFVFYDFLC